MALVKSILFIDGENLAMRYQALLESGRKPKPTVVHIPDIFVWQPGLGPGVINTDILRVNYYTSMVGDDDAIASVKESISAQRYFSHGDYYGQCQLFPRVYKKLKKSTKSRLVDINITIDVMRHAYTHAVDVVYLFSGDGDFVHLVEEVARSGKKVCVGAFSSGLEPRLRVAADRFALLDEHFFEPITAPVAPEVTPNEVLPATPAVVEGKSDA